nr:MAG TPA: hypothetical protein [Inoviridae sp.]
MKEQGLKIYHKTKSYHIQKLISSFFQFFCIFVNYIINL